MVSADNTSNNVPAVPLPLVGTSSTLPRQRHASAQATTITTAPISTSRPSNQPPPRWFHQHRSRRLRRHAMGKQRAVRDLQPLTTAHLQTWLTMYQRRVQRGVHGTKREGYLWEAFAVLVFLVIIIGTGSSTGSTNISTVVGNATTTTTISTTTTDNPFVTLSLTQVIIIGIWYGISLLLMSALRDSPWMSLAVWIVIYLPLLTMAAAAVFGDEAAAINPWNNQQSFWWILLLIAQILAVDLFLIYHYLYPRLVRTEWCKSLLQSTTWKIRRVSEWTMTYQTWQQHGSFVPRRKRYTCKYQGSVCPDTGLPHGSGRWLDDGYHGEVLTGWWHQGQPVAPFYSRHSGSGDAFLAVRILAFLATDDDFDSGSNSFWAANHAKPSRCAMASVECSVSGNFYNHLPRATLLEEPQAIRAITRATEDNGNGSNPIADCIQQMMHYTGEEGETAATILVKANDPRGVQIAGHVYQPTGRSYADEPDQITIQIQKHKPSWSPTSATARTAEEVEGENEPMFMPLAEDSASFRVGTAPSRILADILDEEKDEDYNNNVDNVDTDASAEPDLEGNTEVLSGRRTTTHADHMAKRATSTQRLNEFAALRVDNWIPTQHKEALIFFPGFNSCIRDSHQNFGQFIAMTRLSAHVYPICFCWPGGQILSYHSASRTAAREHARQHLLTLLQGLMAAGIRNVHFMTHSMGAQPLLAAFADTQTANLNVRSDISMCFQLDPDFADASSRDEEDDSSNGHRLVCKSITMLNPDFPLEAFLDRGFATIRRICSTISIVGDRHDQALFYSQAVNGVAVFVGYELPAPLCPPLADDQESVVVADTELSLRRGSVKPGIRKLHYLEVIGRSIESLHFPDSWLDNNNTSYDADMCEKLLFAERAPLVLSSENVSSERLWLDIDVIDTTGLDTNIAGIRHSAFSLNPILLKDMEELITTGKRAMKRSTLLYRDGNLFSYSHAPAFVAA